MKKKIILFMLSLSILASCGSKEEKEEKAKNITPVANVVYSDKDGKRYFAEVDKDGNIGKKNELSDYDDSSVYKPRVINGELVNTDRENNLHFFNLKSGEKDKLKSPNPNSSYFFPWDANDKYAYMADIQSGGSFFKQTNRETGKQESLAFEDYDVDHIFTNDNKLYIFLYRWARETAQCELYIYDEDTLKSIGKMHDFSEYGNSIRSHVVVGDSLYMVFTKDKMGNDNSKITKMNLKTNEITEILLDEAIIGDMQVTNGFLYVSHYNQSDDGGAKISTINLETNQVETYDFEIPISSFLVKGKSIYITSVGTFYSFEIKDGKVNQIKKVKQRDMNYGTFFLLEK